MKHSIYVLYANIFSNATLLEKFDDQYKQRIISSMQRQLTATAEAFNGDVIKSAGEEFMCHFPDIDDAMNGASAIMRAIESGTFPEAWQFSVKTGLSTNEEMLKFDSWGQLANLARPHQILITPEIAKRIPDPSPFIVRELPTVRINMHSSPAWEFRWRDSKVQKSALPTQELDNLPKVHPVLMLLYDDKKRIIQREGDTLSIGRDATNDIEILKDIVSRHHAHITISNGKAVLSDQSTNGTYVFPDNGKPILLLRDKTVLSGSGKISFEYANGYLVGNILEYVVLLEQ